MLHIYLSDCAIKDYKQYASVAPKCWKGLREALSRYQSVDDLLRATRIPDGQPDIKRLKFKPTAWRYHHGKSYRIVFTASKTHAVGSVQVLRIAPRAIVYEGLDKYFENYSYNELQAQVGRDKDDAIEEHTLGQIYPEEQGESWFVPDDIYAQRSKLRVHQLKGAAGSGKTKAALDLAVNSIDQGAYPILVVPNESLQRFSKKHIQSVRSDVQFFNGFTSPDADESCKSGDLAVFTKDQLLRELLGSDRPPLSSPQANYQIREALRREAIPESLRNLDLYALYLSAASQEYMYEGALRDPLLQELEQSDAIAFIRDHASSIENALAGRDFLSQINRIRRSRREKYQENFIAMMAQLKSQSDDAKTPILIIDEVQDFYWVQLRTIFEFYTTRFPLEEIHRTAPEIYSSDSELNITWRSVSKNVGRSIIVVGDNNQRVTLSGFSWAGFATTFSRAFPNSELLPPPEAFNRNYRNTKQIAQVAHYFLSPQGSKLKAFDVDTQNASWIEAPPDPETCETQGTIPKLIETDGAWLQRLVEHLSQHTLDEGQALVFIYNEPDQQHRELWETLKELGGDEANQASDSQPRSQSLYWYSIAEAKGREFRAVTVVFPFAQCAQRGDRPSPFVSELLNWYTALSRSREYLAILASPQEIEWLRRTVRSFEELIEKVDYVENVGAEQFASELLSEAQNEIDENWLINEAFLQISQWLNGRVSVEAVLSPFRRRGYSVWEVLSRIGSEGRVLEVQVIDESLHSLTLEGLSLEATLFVYIVILPLLLDIGSQGVAQSLDRQVMLSLEEYVAQHRQVIENEALPYLQSDNLIGLCLIHRAMEDSWEAVGAIKDYPDAETRDFLYQQISQDLERRGLPWEAARLRHQYLGQEVDQSLPYHELLAKTGDLPTLLIDCLWDKYKELM